MRKKRTLKEKAFHSWKKTGLPEFLNKYGPKTTPARQVYLSGQSRISETLLNAIDLLKKHRLRGMLQMFGSNGQLTAESVVIYVAIMFAAVFITVILI